MFAQVFPKARIDGIEVLFRWCTGPRRAESRSRVSVQKVRNWKQTMHRMDDFHAVSLRCGGM